VEKGRVQAAGGVSEEAMEELYKLVELLHRTGVLPFLVGLLERSEDVLAHLVEENSTLVNNLSLLYSALNGKAEAKDASLTELLGALKDPEVRRGIYVVLQLLKAIGSASGGEKG